MAEILEISPEILSSIKDFDWAIKTFAQGASYGKRQSRKVGTGMEFSQYRPYSQGDDLRQLDWKMYARSDKFYIKQSEVETHLSVTFIIDNSLSMKYKENSLVKMDVAKLLTGVLAYVAMQNGDRIGVAGKPGIPIGYGDRHWDRFLHYLFELDYSRAFIEPTLQNIRDKELFVVLTDMYEDRKEWQQFVKSLNSRKNEVILFHLLGQIEKNLKIDGATTFTDLESGKRLQADPDLLNKSYQKKMDGWISELREEFRASGIDYHQVDYTTPLYEIVNNFLNHRKQLL